MIPGLGEASSPSELVRSSPRRGLEDVEWCEVSHGGASFAMAVAARWLYRWGRGGNGGGGGGGRSLAMGWVGARECEGGVVFAMDDTISGCHVAGEGTASNKHSADGQVALPS